ncbi:MAG: hypothetical protein A3D31_10815 [Candidatus Fluviicola riflensis]|nr:MAG: hypothetical protein CHH17_15235 [Candidatus Fluviicola riflensis]OGS77487.1 MAG: hypothetical protein A3D31_10815 [Candidatus Fluviicola riflensis]OGS84067.1 MAG: hypothetical protein A3E30_12215 [Fluviicola sp. RIFCSPHIGHO2_12_FULL_43_24]OGS84554.1 MAG: hypothetical protein A2724_07755 [Fluviicola sp. RIFCSPHIGHO2_01_FULL_43_53]
MKKKAVLTASLILFCGFLKAQSVAISTDQNKISFLITDKTTKSEIEKADDLFAEHGILTDMKASWKKDRISKLNIYVECAQGSTTYFTTDSENLKKGVHILVDKSPNAIVALAVGSNTEE